MVSKKKPEITFIGLGVMSAPIAGHIADAGYDLTVFTRTPQKISTWLEEHKATLAKTINDSVEDADIILTCVGDDKDLDKVFTNDFISNIKKGTLVIDHTTTSVEIAKEISKKLSLSGVNFIDAPVSGGEIGAKKGSLTIMVGGSKKDFKRAKPILDLYSSAVTLMGSVGSGQLTKMVNQICHAGTIESLAEALNFGKKMGLDMKKAVKVLSKGAARTWHLEIRGKEMLEGTFNFGFANKHMTKDLKLATKEADRNNLPLPITKSVLKRYKKLLDMGDDNLDFSSIIKLLEKE